MLLGVTLESNLTFNKHVSFICKALYYHIRALWHIRNALSNDMAKCELCKQSTIRIIGYIKLQHLENTTYAEL